MELEVGNARLARAKKGIGSKSRTVERSAAINPRPLHNVVSKPYNPVVVTISVVAWLLLIAPTVTFATENTEIPDIGEHLAKLKSPDAEVRIAVLRELQTSLDPRIPDAMLPLLSDEGNSIRRLAARAVGSRWWQIAKEQVPVFVNALRRNETTEYEDEKNMVDRAIGLLTRDYEGKMFARSANKRWVVYERRGLPCLIDTQTKTEELLGWPPDETPWHQLESLGCPHGGLQLLLPAIGNETLAHALIWHPTKEFVAFEILLQRKASMVWVWRHRFGLQKLQPTEVAKALRVKEPVRPGGEFTQEVQGWEGDELRVQVGYDTRTVDYVALLGWNVSKNTLRVITREASPFKAL